MVNQFRQHRTWRLAWLGVWKILERFRIAGKFKARFVDLLNLQISKLTKPTGFTKPTGLIKPTGLNKPAGLDKPTGLNRISQLDWISQLGWIG